MNTHSSISVEDLKRERDYLWSLGDKYNDIINFKEGANTPGKQNKEVGVRDNPLPPNNPKRPSTPSRKRVVDTIVEIIKSEGKFLTRKEIIEIGVTNGTRFSDSVVTSMSSANKKADNELGMVKLGHNEVYWGLKSWIGKNGEPLPEHSHKLLV